MMMLAVACILMTLALPIQAKIKNLEHISYYGFQEYRDRCTAIAVGKLATKDGSTITTHNNDCVECDIRITKVPAKDWPTGSKRPIQSLRAAYPRYVENPENSIHGPDYYISNVDMSIHKWNATEAYYYIDQVPHTYAYTMGAYAIQNEKQVSIGESTCGSIFVGTPVFDGGKAVMHMETLTEIALERCDTARCAIKLMGELAEKYGFFGPEWDANLGTAQDESGEALTVSDPNEAWMFHVMPDDTGASAIWIAQRVPDDHISVVANAFVIGEIDLADTSNFLGSSNIHDIAERHELWSRSSGKKLNFMKTFGTDRHNMAFGCSRRVWRVMTRAAPSLLPQFSPYTDGFQSFGFGPDLKDPYPFSVKPDQLLTAQDVMNFNRDQYEDTDFDMSRNFDGGFFGDTLRYPPTSILKDPVNGISYQEYEEGLGFQRAISLFRTTYSTVTQSRSYLPDVIGGVTWIAQYAPHHSSFVPVYASAAKAPASLNVGTQHKFDKRSNWWIHSIVGNYLSRWYHHTIGDVRAFQQSLEGEMFASQRAMEEVALEKWLNGQQEKSASAHPQQQVTHTTASQQLVSRQLSSETVSPAVMQEIVNMITDYHDRTAVHVRDAWWTFFYSMVGKYRDIYIVENPHAESFSSAFRFMSISRPWLELMGFWGVPGTPPHGKVNPMPVRPINVPTFDTPEEYETNFPNGPFAPYFTPTIFVDSNNNNNDPMSAGSSSSLDSDKEKMGTDDSIDGIKKGPRHGKAYTLSPTMAPTVFKKSDHHKSTTIDPSSNSTSTNTVQRVSLSTFYGGLAGATVVGMVIGGLLVWWFAKRSDYLPLR